VPKLLIQPTSALNAISLKDGKMRETNKQTNKQTKKQTNKQTNKASREAHCLKLFHEIKIMIL
jgi:hypothetical protein